MKLVQLPAIIVGCIVAASAFADTQNPSTPQNVSALVESDTSVSISWNAASDNTGVYGYNVYRDNQYLKTIRSTNYTDTSVSPGSNHEYQVSAFDDARNFSQLSDVAQVTLPGSTPDNDELSQNSDNTGGVSTPTDFQVSALSQTELELEWSEVPNARGYNIYRDRRYHATVVSGTSYLDSVDADRSYLYYITAFDRNDQYSSSSTKVVINSSSASTSSTQKQAQSQLDGGQNSGLVTYSSSVPAGYNLVFNEEFQDLSFDRSKWHTQYRWGPDLIINSEQQYYVDSLNNPDFGHSPFEFDGEYMTISAIPTPDSLRDKARQQPYLSGTITTFDKFTMRYGYVEMRAKMPRGRGMWPAFWLLHARDDDRRPEIDVVELLGHETDLAYHTYHRFDDGNLVSTPTFQAPGPDYAADFHTYAVLWEPGSLVWFIDGVERSRFDDSNVSHEDMYLLLNLAVGGFWPGDPDETTPFPTRYTIDYIRAYTRP